MVIIQTVVSILLALSALGFLMLAIFDKPVGGRRQARMSHDTGATRPLRWRDSQDLEEAA